MAGVQAKRDTYEVIYEVYANPAPYQANMVLYKGGSEYELVVDSRQKSQLKGSLSDVDY